MKINYSWKFAIAFMAFVFLFAQLHEMAHLAAADIICGQPGRQIDFNLWILCKACATSRYAYLPTVFGPVFSYTCYWAGFIILKNNNRRLWPFAFVLIMGNLAFARLFTAGMGGGDETTVLKTLMHAQPLWLIKLTGFVLVSAFTCPPLYMAYKRLVNKHRFWHFLIFCIAPLPIMMVYEFMLLGRILKTGLLATSHYLGIPDFIYLHTLLMFLITLILRKSLFKDNVSTNI